MSYDVHDQYGRKVGELRPHHDSGIGCWLIGFLVVILCICGPIVWLANTIIAPISHRSEATATADEATHHFEGFAKAAIVGGHNTRIIDSLYENNIQAVLGNGGSIEWTNVVEPDAINAILKIQYDYTPPNYDSSNPATAYQCKLTIIANGKTRVDFYVPPRSVGDGYYQTTAIIPLQAGKNKVMIVNISPNYGISILSITLDKV